MTDEEIIRCMKDFFERVPKTVEQRIDLEAWARLNPQGAVEAIKAYIPQRQEELRREEIQASRRTRETQLILAEDYFTPEQKVRLVAAFHPAGDLDQQWYKYGVTLADEYLLESMLYNLENDEYDRDISYTMLASCFEFVRSNTNDPWLGEAVREWDETLERMREKWERENDHPSGR